MTKPTPATSTEKALLWGAFSVLGFYGGMTVWDTVTVGLARFCVDTRSVEWVAKPGPGNLFLAKSLSVTSKFIRVTISRMFESEAAGGLVFNSRGEIAIVQNNNGSWGFPKGHIDRGEDAITAAIREIREETGLTKLTLGKKLGYYQRFAGKAGGGEGTKELKTIHMFQFTTTEEDLEPQDPGNAEAKWVAISDIEKVLSYSADKEFFRGLKLH